MSTTLRGGRLDQPEMPTGEIVLQAPPQLEQHEGASGVLMNAIPMLGSLGSIVLVASIGGAAGGGRSYLAGGMFLFATVGFIVVQIDRQRKQRAQQVTGSRTEYLRYLANVRKVAREAADQQRRALTWQHPAPSALPSLAEERSRVWEHHSSDPHFLHVRYGLCAQPLALELVAPETTVVDQVDPAAASALHRLLVVHRLLPNLPASIDMRAFDRIEVCGPEEEARSLARAMICSAAAFQSPENLEIAVLASEQNLAHWDWMKWLPHSLSTQQSDAVGPMRMVSTSLNDLAALLPPDLSERPRFGADERPATPHLLFVVDGGFLPPGNHVVPPDGLHGVTVLDLPARWDELDDASCLRLLFEADEPVDEGRFPLSALRLREAPVRALADQCDQATAEAFARRLTPLHTVTAGVTDTPSGEIAGPMDFMDLLGLGDVHGFDPALAWRQRPARDRLRVPIGLGDGGNVINLDIKESAQQGMGPHGLVIGATGSGKSEFLRTLVLGLALTHSPEQLNMVLVDFKGGATFAGMSEMPHVSAVITNLAQELTLVDRMQDALSGEMVRRQELLREAGNYASIRDYEKARAAGEALEPLPSLFIVVDEFSEMLSAKPEFIDLFVAIGRLGRSLGLHLLLASQRLEEGRLRGLESHLSYRVGLRTFSAAESRGVLGVPDAYELPPVPGLGFLKPDQSTLLRFKAAYVSGPPTARDARTPRGGRRAARHPAVHDLRGADARAAADGRGARARRRAPAGRAGLAARRRRRPDGGPRPGGAPGLAAAAGRARHPRRPDARPRRGPRARPGLAGVAPARRAGDADRHRRPPARAAPRHPQRQPRRRRGARRRGGRATQRQEHAAADVRHQPRADDDPAGVAVLRDGLRRRRVLADGRAPPRRRRRQPVRARRRPPDRRRGDRHRRPPRGVLPRPGHRLDRDVPLPASPGPGRRRVRRRLPRRRRLEHAARRLRRHRAAPAAAGRPRPDVRLPPAGGEQPLGRLPRGHARHVRHPPRAAARRPARLRDRPPGRGAGPVRPPRPRSGHEQAALPRRAAADRRRPRHGHARRRRRGPGQAGERGLARPARTQAPPAARPHRPRRPGGRGRRPTTRGCCSASTRRSWRRSGSTRTPSPTCSSTATASPARARRCAPTCARSSAPARRSRRSSSSSTTAGRCWARCPRTTCSTTSRPRPRPRRRSRTWRPTSSPASPAPT